MLWKVARVRRIEVRRAGWRTLRVHLDALEVPTGLLQQSLSALKARSRRHERWRRERLRVHVTVLARDVMWSQDATHLGRDCGRSVEGQVVKDVASTRNLSVWIGPSAKGCELVAMLRRTAAERGGWPLVWVSDNGPCNVETELEALLREHRVLHLTNMPHTPENNTWIERGFGEVKAETGLGKGVVLEGSPRALVDLREWLPDAPAVVGEVAQGHISSQEVGVRARETPLQGATWCALLVRAWHKLDCVHVRTSRGGRTAAELDTILPCAEDLVCRDCLYEAACANIERGLRVAPNVRARRRAVREAILATLEGFGLVRRTRG